jgi:hypothetical protein
MKKESSSASADGPKLPIVGKDAPRLTVIFDATFREDDDENDIYFNENEIYEGID